MQPNRTKDTCAEVFRAMIANAARPYAEVHWPEVQPVRRDGIHRHLLFLKRNSQGRLLIELSLSPDSTGKYFEKMCYFRSWLDGLRLVVACRLYEMRRGRLPETLEALVPEYRSEVPRDPFDGKPFRYLPDKAIVYSIGMDLKDSSASGEAVSDEPSGPNRRGNDDLVYPFMQEPGDTAAV